MLLTSLKKLSLQNNARHLVQRTFSQLKVNKQDNVKTIILANPQTR